MVTPSSLRLFATEVEDLQVISAACQDALCKPSDLTYDAAQRRFHLDLKRFRWEAVGANEKKPQKRVRSILAFDSVNRVRSRALPSKSADLVLSLLSLEWRPSEEAPEGKIHLLFSGDGELSLEVECMDVTLIDTDTEWTTRNLPEHKDI